MDQKERKQRFEANLEAVRAAKPGSDLYGVLEKTAFFISKQRKDIELRIWIDANIALAAYFAFPHNYGGEWIDLTDGSDTGSDTGGLKRRLRDVAEGEKQEYEKWARKLNVNITRKDTDFWDDGLARLGQMVSNQFNFPYEADISKIYEDFQVGIYSK